MCIIMRKEVIIIIKWKRIYRYKYNNNNKTFLIGMLKGKKKIIQRKVMGSGNSY